MIFNTTYAAEKVRGLNETTDGVGSFFGDIMASIPYWIAAILVFGLTFVLANLLKKYVINRIISKTKHEVNREVIILTGRAVYAGVLLLGIAISFKIVDFDLLGFLGWIGLGLAFALRDVLANIIAGVTILTQKRFVIGDIVKVEHVFGKITDIDVRVSIVKDYAGTDHMVPNSTMFNAIVQNLTSNETRRLEFPVGVHYATPLDKAIPYAVTSVKKHKSVLKEPAVEVLASGFGESAITLTVRYWIESHDSWPQIQSDIIEKLHADFKTAGIVVPFPIRTLATDPYDKGIKKLVK